MLSDDSGHRGAFGEGLDMDLESISSLGALGWCEGCQGSALEAGKRRGLELAEGSGARAGQTHRANGEEPPGKPDGRPRRLDDGVLF